MLISKATEDGTPIANLKPNSNRLVRLECDGCGSPTVTTFANYTQGQRTTGRKGRTYCKRCVAVQAGRRNAGAKRPKTAARNKQQVGSRHPSWRGGRFVSSDGYQMIRVAARIRGWSGYRKEHLVVMERHLGRKLKPGEIVHHINGQKLENILRNLWLTDGKGHRDAHWSLQLIGFALYAAGLVRFDRKRGRYVADRKLRELLEHPPGESRGQSAAKPFRNVRKVQRLGHGVQTGR